MSGLQFDNKISLGHLVSVVVIIFGMVAGYIQITTTIGVRQEQASLDLDKFSEKFTQELTAMKTGSAEREVRLRALEVAQASQSSDLRAIQSGITRIELQLQKMQDGK